MSNPSPEADSSKLTPAWTVPFEELCKVYKNSTSGEFDGENAQDEPARSPSFLQQTQLTSLFSFVNHDGQAPCLSSIIDVKSRHRIRMLLFFWKKTSNKKHISQIYKDRPKATSLNNKFNKYKNYLPNNKKIPHTHPPP